MAETYQVADMAELLGVSVDTFRRNYRHYVDCDRMPARLTSRGTWRFDRSSVDAWRHRFHPHASTAPANDNGELAIEADIDTWRAELAAEYGRA